MRDLPTIANATPKDYLTHAPKNPDSLALQMIAKAQQLWPFRPAQGEMADPTYTFLFVGPGAGHIVQTLIDQGHKAYGLETSKRGIMSGPELTRSYVKWTLPWEPPFPSMSGDHPTPFKMFHIAIINKYLKEIFTQEEWNATLKEIKKLSRQTYAI